MVGPATPEDSGRAARLTEERIGVVRTAGARHRPIWTHAPERSLGALIERPGQGSEKVGRATGAVWPGMDPPRVLSGFYGGSVYAIGGRR